VALQGITQLNNATDFNLNTTYNSNSAVATRSSIYVSGQNNFVGLNNASPQFGLDMLTGNVAAQPTGVYGPVYVYNSNNANSNAHANLYLRTNGSNSGCAFTSYDNLNVNGWSVGIDPQDAGKFKVVPNSTALRVAPPSLTVTQGGLVGINNSNPACRLHVIGTGSGDAGVRVDVPAGNQCGFSATVGTSNWSILAKPSPNLLSFEYNGTPAATLAPGGNLQPTGVLLTPGGQINSAYFHATYQLSSTLTQVGYYYFGINSAAPGTNNNNLGSASWSNGRNFYPPVEGLWTVRLSSYLNANNGIYELFTSRNCGNNNDLNSGSDNLLTQATNGASNMTCETTQTATVYLRTSDYVSAGVSAASTPGAVGAARSYWCMTLVQRTA
jgi:hypothetical protein